MIATKLMAYGLAGSLVALGGTAWLLKKSYERNGGLETALEHSEAQNAALARRFVEEVEAHHRSRERERQVSDARRVEADLARTEYERISDEIMASLGTEACSTVHVPDAAVSGLRQYAEIANLRSDPGEPVDPRSLRLD